MIKMEHLLDVKPFLVPVSPAGHTAAVGHTKRIGQFELFGAVRLMNKWVGILGIGDYGIPSPQCGGLSLPIIVCRMEQSPRSR